MIRRLMILTVAFVTALTTFTVVANSSWADGDPSSCAVGDFCIWRDIHYVSGGSSTTHYNTLLDRTSFNGFWPGTSFAYDNSASSAYNDGYGGQGAYLYRNVRCSGATEELRVLFGANSGDSDFTNGSPPPGDWNDQGSSASFTGYYDTQCKNGIDHG